MPPKERRDLAVTLVCARCGTLFHPWKGQSTLTRYCSKACAAALGRDSMAEPRAHGHDPAHGGAVADARRAALQRHQAAGELFGARLRQAQRAGRVPVKPPRPVGVSGARAIAAATAQQLGGPDGT